MARTPILKGPKGVISLSQVLAGATLRQVTPTLWFALRSRGFYSNQIATNCASVETYLFFPAVTVFTATPMLEGKI